MANSERALTLLDLIFSLHNASTGADNHPTPVIMEEFDYRLSTFPPQIQVHGFNILSQTILSLDIQLLTTRHSLVPCLSLVSLREYDARRCPAGSEI